MAVKSKPKAKTGTGGAKVTVKPKAKPAAKETPKPAQKQAAAAKPAAAEPRALPIQAVKRKVVNPLAERKRAAGAKQSARSNQFNFMKAPNAPHVFEVGDTVEVFCDHEKNRDRIRGWVKGIIVQVDHKLAAVQFRSNVYLTDGWMVPDRILWFPVNSEHIRPLAGKKPADKKEIIIPDY